MYVYKMVQVPPNVEVQAKQHKGNEAAAYLQSVVNANAEDGWEFYRVDTIGVAVKPGCFAALFGKQTEMSNYYVISFRRPA
ncbi:DUF4177 domain-containing protein [Pseudomonas soli]|uniref:DUF4177 domain-containing protein n=1 Tax=Pseudomonas TaxID=286 RepID=UPI0009E29461|nr:MULTISPECIES: DUF4177 domain-containing protein [Pseudomonas]NBK38133.1 DUF4177 domain-containing protein [Pseudomonas soli]WJO19838.1 DUF4177 domain-containing protein [Pseudomonas soli]